MVEDAEGSTSSDVPCTLDPPILVRDVRSRYIAEAVPVRSQSGAYRRRMDHAPHNWQYQIQTSMVAPLIDRRLSVQHYDRWSGILLKPLMR